MKRNLLGEHLGLHESDNDLLDAGQVGARLAHEPLLTSGALLAAAIDAVVARTQPQGLILLYHYRRQRLDNLSLDHRNIGCRALEVPGRKGVVRLLQWLVWWASYHSSPA